MSKIKLIVEFEVPNGASHADCVEYVQNAVEFSKDRIKDHADPMTFLDRSSVSVTPHRKLKD